MSIQVGRVQWSKHSGECQRRIPFKHGGTRECKCRIGATIYDTDGSFVVRLEDDRDVQLLNDVVTKTLTVIANEQEKRKKFTSDADAKPEEPVAPV